MTDWITAGAAVTAVIISLLALGYSRSSARSSARSAAAAEAAGTAADRQASVAERDEERRLEVAEESAVLWRVDRQSTAEVRLRNIGSQAAYDVHVTIPPGTSVFNMPPPSGETIPRDGHALIGVVTDLDTPMDAHIEVRWRNSPDGSERNWHQPLP